MSWPMQRHSIRCGTKGSKQTGQQVNVGYSGRCGGTVAGTAGSKLVCKQWMQELGWSGKQELVSARQQRCRIGNQNKVGANIGRAEKVPKQQVEARVRSQARISNQVSGTSRVKTNQKVQDQVTMVEADKHSAILWSLEPL